MHSAHARRVATPINLLLLTLALASGCGARKPPTQVERDYVVDASRSPATTFGREVLSARVVMGQVEISAEGRARSKPASPVQSFQSNAHTTCTWLLAATGERFASKNAALDFADEKALTDRRVGEICSPSRQQGTHPRAALAAARAACVLGTGTLASSCAGPDEKDEGRR